MAGLALILAVQACRPSTTAAPSAPSPSDAGFATPPNIAVPTAVPPRANDAGLEASHDASHDASCALEPADAETKAGAETLPAEPSHETSEPPSDMLRVPGGTFTMGAAHGGEGDERPAHDVTLAAFDLDRTEVTQAAYAACVEAGHCARPDAAILSGYGGRFRGPQKPVVGVSWFDADKYCAWQGKRLPREAEFERAVRGEDGRRFPWGDDAPSHERTVFSTNAPEDVATHPAGRGPYGHDDLAGNVWEWLADDYDPFAYTREGAHEGLPGSCTQILAAQNELRKAKKQGFTGSNPIPTECEKGIRGGAYNYPAAGLRSTNRIHHPPRFKLRMTGLRCAKDAR